MRVTKDEAKRQVAVYSSLLQDRAVISEIGSREVRQEIEYSFTTYEAKIPCEIRCTGIKNLAIVLSCMWAAYLKARSDLGFQESEDDAVYSV